MARLPRLAVPELPHLLLLRGHNLQPVFVDDEDRCGYLAALREAAGDQRVAVLAYCLLHNQVQLLVVPPSPQAIARMLQALGRRYGAAFNRRHHRSGTLWDGRYRCTVLEPREWAVAAMRCIEQTPMAEGETAAASDWRWSSAPHHLGRDREVWLTDPTAYWALGNTPFEREMAWAKLLEEPLADAQRQQILDAAHKGWALGSGTFIAQLGTMLPRPLQPRPRGRPRTAPQE